MHDPLLYGTGRQWFNETGFRHQAKSQPLTGRLGYTWWCRCTGHLKPCAKLYVGSACPVGAVHRTGVRDQRAFWGQNQAALFIGGNNVASELRQ